MPDSVGPHSIQNAPARKTEGQREGQKKLPSAVQAGASRNRGAGRPKGSKNKSKGLLPTELANTILLQMKEMLPPEHFQYMKGVIKEGKAISTKQELDTLILLLSRNLYPALIMEQFASDDTDDDFFNEDNDPKEVDTKIKMPVFRKDVTERLKVLQGLLSLRNQVEKRDADNSEDEKPILKIVGGRGIDADRLRILVGIESSPMAGNVDRIGQQANEARTVSDTIPERPELLSPSKQGETDWVFDSDRSGGTILRSDEDELQG